MSDAVLLASVSTTSWAAKQSVRTTRVLEDDGAVERLMKG